MKLCLVSHNLELEGASWSLFYLAKGLKSKDFQIEVIAPKNGPLSKFYKNECINLKVVNFFDFKSYNNTKNIRADVFFVNTILGYKFIKFLSDDKKRKVLWCIRESEKDVYFKNYQDLNPELFYSTKKIVFVSEKTRSIYKNLERNNFITIHNGLDFEKIDKFISKNKKNDLRNKYGFSNKDVLINLTGTVCLRKGQMEFVQSSIKVLKNNKFSDLKFLIIGAGRGGGYEKQLRTIIRESGYSRYFEIINETPDVFDYYLMSDIFICNSYIESFPRVILEAMAFSLPIIATNVYGIPEQIDNHKDGVLIMAGDTMALKEKIENFLENPTEAIAMGENARKKLEEKFSFEIMLNKYESLIRSLCVE